MAYAHLSLGEVSPAEKNLHEVITFCKVSGYEYLGTSADALSCVVEVAKGNIGLGVKAINRHNRQYMAQGKFYHAQTFHYMLGSIYQRIALREGDLGLSKLVKNIFFLVAHLPWAVRYSENHFKAAIRIAEQINANGVKGQALFDLGRLYQAKKREHLAVPLIKESIALFEQLGASGHLKRAQAALNRVSERTENRLLSLRCCAALSLQAEPSPRQAAGRVQCAIIKSAGHYVPPPAIACLRKRSYRRRVIGPTSPW